MDLELPGKDEGGTEDQETFVIDEVLFVHQHECGGGDQSDCGRTQTRKGGNDIFVVLELGKKVGDVVHVQVNANVGYDVEIKALKNTEDDGDKIRSF